MATIEILGVRHTYDLTPPIASSTPVLVFIHGWLLSRRYWQPLIEQIAPDYQCLSYDLRGFGDSQPLDNYGFTRQEMSVQSRQIVGESQQEENFLRSSEPLTLSLSNYTPAAYAKEVGILLQKLNISSAWLIGHSLGGSIALWAADQQPDSVKGVVCINAGGGIYLKEAFERFRAAGQQLLKRRPHWLCYVPGIDLPFTRAQVARPIARCWGRQRLIDFITAHPEAALGTLLDSTTEAEVNRLPQVVSRLKQPVYFIAGAKDRVMEPKYVRHLASFHPLFQGCGENVMEIPDCGHLSMVEQPEAVATEIRKIIANCPDSSNFA
ncbi:alpha/beta hydrolase [Trichocoleus sp. ST-U3]|uniref:alpha/beta fold hydrolase n=1 Tax=Coleofasciculus sp. FACHB-542 TaxID=2692787 RepID=UPI0016837510|nr:alpha/beta hydrolase [Coleofasciculus sp. FACHB-542]MBD2087370.1 alpha/beta hydrolase [Coleofasciculus sp. FACHB-542]